MRRSRIMQIKPKAVKPQPKKPYVSLSSVYESIKPAVNPVAIPSIDFSAYYISMLHEMSHADLVKALKNPALKPSDARALLEHMLPHQRRALLEEQALHEFSAAGGLMTGGYDAGGAPSGTINTFSALLQEDAGSILLESGDYLLLEQQ